MKQSKPNIHARQLERMKGKVSGPTSTSWRTPSRPYEPGEEAWYQHTDAQVARFVREQRAALGPLIGVDMALHVCADCVWEHRRGAPAWDVLPIDELWRRLTIQEQFLPQPLIVVAFHEGLQLFLPWLVRAGALSREACRVQLSELARVRSPLFEQACETIVQRAESSTRAEPSTRPGFGVPN